jgi:hypothetical protein
MIELLPIGERIIIIKTKIAEQNKYILETDKKLTPTTYSKLIGEMNDLKEKQRELLKERVDQDAMSDSDRDRDSDSSSVSGSVLRLTMSDSDSDSDDKFGSTSFQSVPPKKTRPKNRSPCCGGRPSAQLKRTKKKRTKKKRTKKKRTKKKRTKRIRKKNQ